MSLAIGAMLLAAATATPAGAHQVTVQHPSGPVQADYRGTVQVEHRQLGTVAPGGRPSTLRCAWTAHLSVDRAATRGQDASFSRSFVRNDVASGSRPGWCSTNRDAIARDVAARVGDTGRHLALAAGEDRPVLDAELDRLPPARSTS